MSINPCDTKVSMLLSLLLAIIRILSCLFFFFLVIFSTFLTIHVVREQNKVRPALVLVNEIIDTPPLLALKTINAWSI